MGCGSRMDEVDGMWMRWTWVTGVCLIVDGRDFRGLGDSVAVNGVDSGAIER